LSCFRDRSMKHIRYAAKPLWPIPPNGCFWTLRPTAYLAAQEHMHS
jgi:hypothetical protein